MSLSFNHDDLHRVREAIQKGWDFPQAYGIDFERLCLELLDDALDGGASLGQQVVDLYPGTTDLDNVKISLEELAENKSGDLWSEACDTLHDAAEKLDAFICSMQDAEHEAQCIVQEANQ